MVKELKIEKNRIPQYNVIKEDTAPIFIWGCGALGISVYNYCIKFGISIEGIFVDIPNDVNNILEKQKILSIEEVIMNYKKFSVIIGHSNYEQGIKQLTAIKNVKNIYCISSLCYDRFDLIPLDFIQKESHILNTFYAELSDTESKNCLKSYLESRINDNPQYMFPYFKQDVNYFINDVIKLNTNETLLDIGACNGEAIWMFLNAVNYNYKSVIALEPEENNYLLLQKKINKRNLKNIITKQVCAYNQNKYVQFEGNMERGGIKSSNHNSDYKLYPAVTIDSLCTELNVEDDISIIKINFAFSVTEVLEGAKSLLKTKKPKVIIRAGFDENVLLKAYLLIKKINPAYKIYLRYSIGIPQGLTLFAV